MRPVALLSAILLIAVLSGRSLVAPASSAYDPGDEWQGLPAGEGREEVLYSCTACHSTAIIQQQRFTRRVWNEVVDWMVEGHGMIELEADDRRRIIDYLVEHFGFTMPAQSDQ